MNTLGRKLRRWSYSEIKRLQILYDAGKTRAEICAALQMTNNQVRSRLQWEGKKTNGLKSRNRRYFSSDECGKNVPQWTPEEIEIGRQLVARRASDDECLAAIGRSFHACYVKIDREGKLPRARTTPQPVLPPGVLEAAAKRLHAPRPLTAWICGDPAPGCSALDQRESIA